MDQFEQSALGHAYRMAGELSAGSYYPWIYVVNFDTGTIKKFEVELIVNSENDDPFPGIPDATARINSQLVVDPLLQQDVENSQKIIQALEEFEVLLPRIYYYFGAENVFDVLGNRNAYREMADAYVAQLRDGWGWAGYSLNWSISFVVAISQRFSNLEQIATVEFADGSFIDFIAKPQYRDRGEPLIFEFEFKRAFDSDGNEVFEDPEIYLNETFITDLGDIGGFVPEPSQIPLTSYLQSLGWDVNVHDGRGSFGCITVAVTYCYYGPDQDKQCDTELKCQ